MYMCVITCHSNETHAPTANPPNSAQLESTPYHSSKLHLGPWSSVRMQRGTERQTDTQTHRRLWPIYISPRLCLTRNVIMSLKAEAYNMLSFVTQLVVVMTLCSMHINEVILCESWLLLRWATIGGYIILVCNQLFRQTHPPTLRWITNKHRPRSSVRALWLGR